MRNFESWPAAGHLMRLRAARGSAQPPAMASASRKRSATSQPTPGTSVAPSSRASGDPEGRRYWLAVASREHVQTGVRYGQGALDSLLELGACSIFSRLHRVSGGFGQACHGKSNPLARMRAGDGIVYYSSVEKFGSKIKCQRFTALGSVAPTDPSAPASATPYQVELAPGTIAQNGRETSPGICLSASGSLPLRLQAFPRKHLLRKGRH